MKPGYYWAKAKNNKNPEIVFTAENRGVYRNTLFGLYKERYSQEDFEWIDDEPLSIESSQEINQLKQEINNLKNPEIITINGNPFIRRDLVK